MSKGVTVKINPLHFFPSSPSQRHAGNVQKMRSLVLMTTTTLASRCKCATEIHNPKFAVIPHCQRSAFVIFSRRLAHDEAGGGGVVLYLEAMAD